MGNKILVIARVGTTVKDMYEIEGTKHSWKWWYGYIRSCYGGWAHFEIRRPIGEM